MKIKIIQPDDWHVHFRDNEILKMVVPETAKYFKRALVMPNTIPPIFNGEDAKNYKSRIMNSLPQKSEFSPKMTIYLNENTDISDLKTSYRNNFIFGAKLYPAGATTNSQSGVKNFKKLLPVLETMSEIGMPLMIHGEVTDNKIDIFDREKVFIESILDPICQKLPNLKITLEHITTKDAVEYVMKSSTNLCASITPHHLALNRNHLLAGGIRPHFYCLPIVKREHHRQALVDAATSGNKKFFLGTDSAPHLIEDKETSCGCAGIYNTMYCLQILAQIFDDYNSINNLQQFVSLNGANHYNEEQNTKTIVLVKKMKPLNLKKFILFKNNKIEVFNPGFEIFWDIQT